MKTTQYQRWPDGTRVRFTGEATQAMQNRPDITKPLRTPGRGPDAVYTIDNTDDDQHDVLLRETGERYGTSWLFAAPVSDTTQDPDQRLLEGSVDGKLTIGFESTRGRDAAVRPSWQRGNWMQTYTGGQFYPLDPQTEDVDILDIAHALSMQCRYNGHVRKFMSVAEHCVLVSRLVPSQHALWGLLHDATEAYVGDMVRPLKLHMPEYRAVENQVMRVIAERFGLGPAMPTEIKQVDSRILLDERAALMDEPAGDWQIEGEPFGIEIPAWDPATAKQEYLQRFAELTGGPAERPVGLLIPEEQRIPL